MGQQIGLHPLETLISVFLGMQLFAFPVAQSLPVQLSREGILPRPSWMGEKNCE